MQSLFLLVGRSKNGMRTWNRVPSAWDFTKYKMTRIFVHLVTVQACCKKKLRRHKSNQHTYKFEWEQQTRNQKLHKILFACIWIYESNKYEFSVHSFIHILNDPVSVQLPSTGKCNKKRSKLVYSVRLRFFVFVIFQDIPKLILNIQWLKNKTMIRIRGNIIIVIGKNSDKENCPEWAVYFLEYIHFHTVCESAKIIIACK